MHKWLRLTELKVRSRMLNTLCLIAFWSKLVYNVEKSNTCKEWTFTLEILRRNSWVEATLQKCENPVFLRTASQYYFSNHFQPSIDVISRQPFGRTTPGPSNESKLVCILMQFGNPERLWKPHIFIINTNIIVSFYLSIMPIDNITDWNATFPLTHLP